MRTFFDCIPCFVRQALDSVRLVTDDEAVHERVVRGVLAAAAKMDLRESPPAMGQRIHRLIRELTGEADPYRAIKDRFNRLALGMYPALKDRVDRSADPLATAVRLAIAGNIIDFGVNGRLGESQVHDSIKQSLVAPLFGDVAELARAADRAEDILYLADNAGEIVLDRLLIERLPTGKITLVVKGSPVINDATLIDAEAAGLTALLKVIDNGSDAPGTILAQCSETFRDRFEAADLILAKGQGNYETLSEADKDIFFILKAKCPVIARDLGCEVGSGVLTRSDRSGLVGKEGPSAAES